MGVRGYKYCNIIVIVIILLLDVVQNIYDIQQLQIERGVLALHNEYISFNIRKEERSKIEKPFRPNHDDYFMRIAYVLKSRSNCMKKSVGAVLVDKHRRIISTR